jgi:phage regulator Rha-like protein
VDVDHYFIAQMFEKKMNNLLRSIEERQVSKKRTNHLKSQSLNFFFIKDTIKKEDVS